MERKETTKKIAMALKKGVNKMHSITVAFVHHVSQETHNDSLDNEIIYHSVLDIKYKFRYSSYLSTKY